MLRTSRRPELIGLRPLRPLLIGAIALLALGSAALVFRETHQAVSDVTTLGYSVSATNRAKDTTPSQSALIAFGIVDSKADADLVDQAQASLLAAGATAPITFLRPVLIGDDLEAGHYLKAYTYAGEALGPGVPFRLIDLRRR